MQKLSQIQSRNSKKKKKKRFKIKAYTQKYSARRKKNDKRDKGGL